MFVNAFMLWIDSLSPAPADRTGGKRGYTAPQKCPVSDFTSEQKDQCA